MNGFTVRKTILLGIVTFCLCLGALLLGSFVPACMKGGQGPGLGAVLSACMPDQTVGACLSALASSVAKNDEEKTTQAVAQSLIAACPVSKRVDGGTP